MLDDSDAIRKIKSPDGKKVFELLKRPDGYYRYQEYTELTDESPAGRYTYWGPTCESGIFEDEASALREAIQDLPWLEAEISN